MPLNCDNALFIYSRAMHLLTFRQRTRLLLIADYVNDLRILSVTQKVL